MAVAIHFKPKPVDPKLELQKRLDAAPREHAEALLVAYDLLGEAHRQGILDALHGAVGAKDTLVSLIAKYAAEPESVNAIRNLLALAKVLGTLDPQGLSLFAKESATAMSEHSREKEAPSLWQIFKRVSHPDARRGLGLMTSMLGALGRSAKQ